MLVKLQNDLFAHVAWAMDEEGTDFSLAEFDGALYVGSYFDSKAADSSEPEMYTWTANETLDADQNGIVSMDEITAMLESESEEYAARIEEVSGNLEGTQSSADQGIGNVNQLEGTNNGTEGYSVIGSYSVEALTDTVYTDTEEIEGIRITRFGEIDGVLLFDAAAFVTWLSENPAENAYTMSADIRQSEMFILEHISVSDDDGENALLSFDEHDPTSDEMERDLDNTWMRYTSTAQLTEVAAAGQSLVIDLSRMPVGATMDIANLKIEEGGIATPWRESLAEINIKADRAREAALEVLTRANNGEFDGKDGEDAVLLRIDSSRGNVFKNSNVETILTVTVIKAGDTITNSTYLKEVFGQAAYLQWYWRRIDDDQFYTLLPTDSMISDDGFTLRLTPDKVDTKVTFQCELVV